ncbi:hypothetical protein ACLOJK_005573 [Asimina triloba]
MRVCGDHAAAADESLAIAIRDTLSGQQCLAIYHGLEAHLDRMDGVDRKPYNCWFSNRWGLSFVSYADRAFTQGRKQKETISFPCFTLPNVVWLQTQAWADSMARYVEITTRWTHLIPPRHPLQYRSSSPKRNPNTSEMGTCNPLDQASPASRTEIAMAARTEMSLIPPIEKCMWKPALDGGTREGGFFSSHVSGIAAESALYLFHFRKRLSIYLRNTQKVKPHRHFPGSFSIGVDAKFRRKRVGHTNSQILRMKRSGPFAKRSVALVGMHLEIRNSTRAVLV